MFCSLYNNFNCCIDIYRLLITRPFLIQIFDFKFIVNQKSEVGFL
jgi:hypothetical protein